MITKFFLYLIIFSTFSFSSFSKVAHSSELVEILTLVLSQSKTLSNEVTIFVTGEDPKLVNEIRHKLQKIPFVMIQARPSKLLIQKSISPNTNVLLNLSDKTTNKQPGLLTISLTKKQVILGSDIGIVFENTRPVIYLNRSLLKNTYHKFQPAFLQISKIIRGIQ